MEMESIEVQISRRVICNGKEEDVTVCEEPRSDIHQINVDIHDADATTKESVYNPNPTGADMVAALPKLASTPEPDHVCKYLFFVVLIANVFLDQHSKYLNISVKKIRRRKVDLFDAALNGDWKTAKSIFELDPSTLTMNIGGGNTTLHMAACGEHVSFVRNLVQLISSSDLTIKNYDGNTALALASTSGVLNHVKLMVDKNPTLPNLPNPQNPQNPVPVFVAIARKCRDIASFLFPKTNFYALDTFQQTELFIAAISVDYYDIALKILKMKPGLALERRKENGDTALHVLARKPHGTIGSSSELSLKFCNTLRFLGFKGIYNKFLMQRLARQVVERIWEVIVGTLIIDDLKKFIQTPSRLMHDAARVGNAEILIVLIRSNIELVCMVDDDNKTIFHVAAENQQEDVFTLIYQIEGVLKNRILFMQCEKHNYYNMLHMVGKLDAPSRWIGVPRPALQYLRELAWFKAVEDLMFPEVDPAHYRFCSSPLLLFQLKERVLLDEAKDEMTITATRCMLVAILIVMVVSIASFLMAKGNDGDTNIHAFTAFIKLNIVAVVSSTTSIVACLCILAPQHLGYDFLVLLPIKLLVGLTMLFVSGVCVVLTFSVTFFTAYHKAKAKFLLAIGAATIIVPFCSVCVLHSKLAVDIMRFLYWYKFSLKRCKRELFQHQNC